MSNNELFRPDNPELIQSYINALVNLISMERAKTAANNSEQAIIHDLSSLGASNGIYLTQEDIPLDIQESVVKESVSAHLTKIQSQQIAQTTLLEVARSETDIKKQYIGKKVSVIVLDSKHDNVDAVYLDKNSASYRVSKYNAKKIKGTIDNIVFENNLLVIKPTFSARLVVPNRVFIHVYVINIETMTPNISIKL